MGAQDLAESLQAMKLDPIQPLGIGHVVFASADQSYMAFDTTKHEGCEVATTKHLACTSERANAYDKILRDGDWPFGHLAYILETYINYGVPKGQGLSVGPRGLTLRKPLGCRPKRAMRDATFRLCDLTCPSQRKH